MRIFEATDKLTIRRLMALMAGIAVALVVFRNRNSFDPWDTDRWRELATTVLLGCSLPGLFCTLGQQGRARAGLGSLLWSTLSIGSLLMLPPAIGGPLMHNEAMGSNSAGMCLFYVLPLVSLWFLLSALASGRLGRRQFRAETRWSERFGLQLGLLWSILGVWLLWDFYRDAFFK